MRAAVLCAIATVAAAGGGGEPMAPDNVLALDDKTFSEHIGWAKPALVEFYAPWCGHCKNLAPEWVLLDDTFTDADPVIIAKVDADANKELASKFGVTGFPTIKWFDAGSSVPKDYEGGRTADDLVKYVNEKIGTSKKVARPPSAVADLDETNFDATVGDASKFSLVEFFAPWCGHCKALAPTYEKLAAAFESEPNVVIAKVDADKHRDLGSRFGVSGFPTLKWFNAGTGNAEARVTDFDGARDLASLVAYVNEKAGTHRDEKGGLLPSAGRLPAFDVLAAEFFGAADKKAVEAKAAAAAAALSKADADKAAVYLTVMKRVLEKGATWLATESARVDGMLASPSVSKTKKAELGIKRHVIAAFAAPAAPESVEDADEL